MTADVSTCQAFGQMTLRAFAPAALAALLGCTSSELRPLPPLGDSGSAGGADAGANLDAGTMSVGDAGTTTIDAGSQMGDDAGNSDDSAAPIGDAGAPPTADLVPGRLVRADGHRINIGDRFSAVVAALGAGTRSAQMNARSYAYDIASGGTLTVWYANTNLDDDDAAPADVDADDKVLWIAVDGGFVARTPADIRMGSTKAEVRAAYGTPSRSSTVNDPPGTVDAYFETGILAAYGLNDQVRTITISRAYPNDPDGQLELSEGRIRFGNDTIQGDLFSGTGDGDVKRILGDPADGEGPVDFNGTTLQVLSYGFIGLEFFTGRRTGRTLFISVHAPFYGTAGQGADAVGIGSTRAEFESYLAGEGFDPARMSTAMNVFCYRNRNTAKVVGASYSADRPPAVTTISVGLPDQACPR